MPEPHVVSALRQKRSETAGLILQREREIDRLRADLMHLDAALRIFAPDLVPDDIPAKAAFPKRSAYFQRGELTRRIYDSLRARSSVSTGELTAEAMQDKGIPRGDRAIRRDFAHRFIMALHQLRRQGSIEKLGAGQGVRWKLAGEA
jgi:hypothetical protein